MSAATTTFSDGVWSWGSPLSSFHNVGLVCFWLQVDEGLSLRPREGFSDTDKARDGGNRGNSCNTGSFISTLGPRP